MSQVGVFCVILAICCWVMAGQSLP